MAKDNLQTDQQPIWRSIAARKQAIRSSLIPKDWTLSPEILQSSQQTALQPSSPWRTSGILTQWELHLTDSHDATSLLGLLTTGALKSEDVVRAFCKRAAIAQQLTNCLTEIMFDAALVRAQELDAHLTRTGRPIGPLHGLPISMKDTFKLVGVDSSVGIAGLCFKPADTNSALVDLLLELGAVIHVKTNVPQTMMALDSHNNVFGRTLNPANNALTAGGSSGGEGALIAMKGSPLGVGTDVGGSIRVPAACNGLYGIKPSIGFVPYAGQEEGSKPGAKKLALEPVAGPIAGSLRDCEMLMRTIANANPTRFDPDVLIGTWNKMESLPRRNLTIGIIHTDGHVNPLPIINKLMHQISTTLSQNHHHQIEIIHLDVSSILTRALKTFNGIISIDGANTWLDHLDTTSEPLSPWLQNRLTRRNPKSLEQVRELQAQKMDLQAEFLRVWQEKGGYWLPDTNLSNRGMKEEGNRILDAIIMPLAPHPILPIDRWNTVNYTAALNLLDLPSGVLPVRKVSKSDLEAKIDTGSKPLNGWDEVNREHWTDVNRSVYEGSTLSVQVIAPRLRERRLVEVMGVVAEVLEPLGREDGGRGGSKL